MIYLQIYVVITFFTTLTLSIKMYRQYQLNIDKTDLIILSVLGFITWYSVVKLYKKHNFIKRL